MVWWLGHGLKSGGQPPHSKLTAGEGGHVALRANRTGRGGDVAGALLYGLGKGEQGSGVGGCDRTTVGEGNGDIGRGDVLWEFGDGEEIEASGGEE